MARVPLSEIVFQAGRPATYAIGASVYVYKRGTTEQVSLYTKEVGGSEVIQPLTSDEGGRLRKDGEIVWVAPGSYDLLIGDETVSVEAASGSVSAEGGVSLGEVETLVNAVVNAEASAREAADAGKQPLDADLTSIAALATTEAGRALLTKATVAALRSYLEVSSDVLVVLKSLVDAKGDLLVGTADNTVARKAAGSDGKVLSAASGESDGLAWVANADSDPHGFAIRGKPDVDTYPGWAEPVITGEVKKLIGMNYRITGGTKVKVTLLQNGSAVTGFKEIEVTTTVGEVSGKSVAVSHGDIFELKVELIEGAVERLQVTPFIERTHS